MELAEVVMNPARQRIFQYLLVHDTATVKALPLTVRGFRPIAEAIITTGGVSVREVDAKTMESMRCRGLYFAGEVRDVDAYTGGFNLQIAFSTAAAAGRALQSEAAGE